VIEVLGIRHHGPGSARSVRAALDEVEPTIVLIEGAPELDAVVALAASEQMVPPVAGLVYALDRPRAALFYPLAAFSPEWVALRWALARDVPVRFADLPGANLLAASAAEALQQEDPQAGVEAAAGEPEDGSGRRGGVPPGAPDIGTAPPVVLHGTQRPDPIATLAELAGYDDPEQWWEDAIEHRDADRGSVLGRFASVRAAMAEIRRHERALEAEVGDPADEGEGHDQRDRARHRAPWREENDRREAAMRKAIRTATAEGHERIVFVCGAYHAPALVPDAHPPVSHDNRLLKGLPKVKVGATWAPWTSGRLAAASGYGAGVTSPGWYRHLFVTIDEAPDEVVARWMVEVAGALRDEQLDASTGSVVEATRLASALAAIRRRPSPGLEELNDATQAVLCDGSPVPLQLIHRRLVVGEELGSVPDDTPMVPLAADLARQQRTLRLKVSATEAVITVDLRKDSQLARSVLFHRLAALGIEWAVPVDAGRTTGTFKEAWRLEWRPDLAVALIEAGVHGTTIESAAIDKITGDAARAEDLAALAGLVERCLLADLAEALAAVVHALEVRTAQQHDTLALLAAVGPLARTCRYGNVRGADVSALGTVLDTVVTRAAIGLRPACASLDDDAADQMRAEIEAAHAGVLLLDRAELRAPWLTALAGVAAQDGVHGSVSGRVNRLLLDAGSIDVDEAGRRLSRRLSVAADAGAGAAWLDGFLAGDAVLLLHDADLLATIDRWITDIGDEVFEDLLPLLRRTFSRYERPERRLLGEHLLALAQGSSTRTELAATIDEARAAPAMRTVAALLGWEVPS
jgi:hypothetical protein